MSTSLQRYVAAAALGFTAIASAAGAIVIRHDVDDAQYRIPASTFPALADMPGEGHGVLIAPQWVVTAAHAVTWQHAVDEVVINGQPRRVERMVLHPGYTKPPQRVLDEALATWDWTLFRSILASSDDIALLKLAQPVTDVSPPALNTDAPEYGEVVQIIGKGATGKGDTGYAFEDSHRTQLRRAYNRISSAHGRWICYVFDEPSSALPLEGGSGSGDSGGPILMQTDSRWVVAGLTSWTDPQSTVRVPGRYGQVSCNVRLSHYRAWIYSVMASSRPKSSPARPDRNQRFL